MLHYKTTWKTALLVGFIGVILNLPALGQGSPDIIWLRKVVVDRVNNVIFTPDGNTLISGGSDRLIKFWRVSDGALMQTLNTNAPFVHESAIEWLSITRDGSLLASCSFELIQLWDLPSGEMRRVTGHTDWVVSVAFSPNGNLLASASFDGTVKVWNPSDGSLVTTITAPGQQRCVAFSPDGSLLAAASGDNRVRLYRTSDWSLARELIGHTSDVFVCTFSPDGNTLASGGYDDTARIWNVSDGTLKHTFSGNGGNVYSVAFTPDGTQLALTDGEGNTVKIYRTSDGTLVRTFTEEVNDVQTVAFSPDGLLGYGRIDETVVLARISGATSARITSPISGTTYTAPANISITAVPSKNDGSVTRMEFFQNGSSLGEDLAPPFSFNWNDVPAGTYTLTAVETDNLGASKTTGPISVVVTEQSTNQAPTIVISSPASGASFPAGTKVTITANGFADAGVAKVTFFQNGTSIGDDTRDPFQTSWSTQTMGTYVLTATITDKNGAVADSPPVTITITEPPPELVKPRVRIISPPSGARLTAPDVFLRGTASDNVGVTEVLYSVNSDEFRPAIGTETWEAGLTLVPGANIVQVKSRDAAGNESSIATRKFVYVVSSPVTMHVNGIGVVRPLRDGQVLEVGKRYSIRAFAGRDQIFNGWTGTIETNAKAFSFLMEHGMILTANFVPNPFAAVKGTYLGLVQSATASHENTGFIRISTTSSGSFSGKISRNGKNQSVRGKFNGDGTFFGTVSKSGLTLALHVDLTNQTDQITGTVSDEFSTAEIIADRAVFSRTNPAPAAGRYTILVPGNSADAGTPQGSGFGTLKVDTQGKTRISGSLADGTAFSQGAGISKNGEWPFYVASYRGKGSISGLVRFRDEPGTSDLDGTVNWFRPEDSKAKLFQGGFATETTLVGSSYSQTSGSPVLQVPETEDNILIHLGNGDLDSDLQHHATLISNNRFVVTDSGAEKLRIAVSASSGSLKGSFVHPTTGKTTRHRGIVFQKQNLAEGYFLGTTHSGIVSVVPADESGFNVELPQDSDPVEASPEITEPVEPPTDSIIELEPRLKRKRGRD